MNEDFKLPDDQVWQGDGHLSEVALTVVSDGETSLVPEAALSHLDACDACNARLGQQALVAIELDTALAPNVLVAEGAPARVPVAAIVAALVVALVSAVPSLIHAPAWLADLPATVTRVAPVALRVATSLVKVASTGSAMVLVVSFVAALLLAAMGLVIARLAPRESAVKGALK
jgi:hypothetical protein